MPHIACAFSPIGSGAEAISMSRIYCTTVYVYFGENPREAVDRVEARLSELRLFIGKLEGMPHRGMTRDDLMKGLRILPDRRKAAIAFMVDDHRKTVHVLRVFYGGEDYDAVMAGMEDDI